MFLDDFAVLILYIDKGCVVVPSHFEFYILKCKNFSIEFLNELDNFKQKNFSKFYGKVGVIFWFLFHLI